MMARQTFKEEFRLRNVLYHFEDETAFYRCQWKWPRCIFLLIRALLAGYALFGFILELVDYYDNARIRRKSINVTVEDQDEPSFDDWDTRRPWCVYFTLWTYMVLVAHLLLAALLSVLFPEPQGNRRLAFSREKRRETDDSTSSTIELPSDDESEPLVKAEDFFYTPRRKSSSRSTLSDQTRRLAWYFKLSWFLSNIISACAPIVTTIFFAALYEGGPVDIYNTNVHILNTVFVVLDHLVSARPVRLLHWPAPVLFGACYVLFSYIFWTFDHEHHVVYEDVLDWNKPRQAAGNSLTLAFVIVPLLHSVYYLIYRLKLWAFDKIYAPQSLL